MQPRLRKALVSAIACCITIGSGWSGALGAEASKAAFADAEGHWAKEYVDYLSAKGIVDGVEKDGKRWILPDQTITRAEYMKILVGALKKDGAAGQTASFQDVGASHWAYKYVETAKKEGWVDGYEDGNFRPDSPISRAELATMLVRAYKLQEKQGETLSFADVASDYWAYPTIKTAASLKLVEGVQEQGKTWFKPAASATRAESMTVIARYMKSQEGSAEAPKEEAGKTDPVVTPEPPAAGAGSGSGGGSGRRGDSGVTISLSGADLIASVGKGSPIAGTDGQGNKVELTGLNLTGFTGNAADISVTAEPQETTFRTAGIVVPGITGPVLEFTTNGKTFSSATLSVNVDSSVNKANLVAAYFNETTHSFEFLQTSYDNATGSISFTTNHNSKYVLIDKLAWEQAWKNSLSVSEGVYKPYVDYAFIIDSSGSMTWNDPDDLRKKAVTGLVYSLNYNPSSPLRTETVTVLGSVYTNSVHSESDRAAIIDFDNAARVFATFSADGATVARAVYNIDSSGGTNIFSGLKLAFEQFASNGDPNHRYVAVVLTDGQDSDQMEKDWNMIQTAYGSGVTLVTMGLSREVDQAYLQKMAYLGGGQYFQVLTAEELENSFRTVVETTRHNEPVDTDNDGLDDYYEVTGMLLANGMLVKTSIDPVTGRDTDGDGFTDGEEMGQPEEVLITAEMVPQGSDLVGKTVKMFKHMKSLPTDPNDKP
ncbi:S-layer homology domain-containing protein [Paenibacillus sp. H1-7]|uniref:S-layer homology domain-containing protein n=1 Tax=Paenibacillus sp. H1-7 TaxID=2282849 RepID=UPI001EF86043|nr:S-layer homology domain-containing protein [Paenibacillus sp. H1-7]